MTRVAIIGAGDLGQQIAHYIRQSNNHQVVGFYDDFAQIGEQRNGTPVLGTINELMAKSQEVLFDELLLGIGYKHIKFRRSLFEQLQPVRSFATFIHPTCTIDPDASIEAGSVLFPCVHLDRNAKIKKNVVVNIGVTVSHDSEIDSHCFVSPRVAIAGFSYIGKRCILGINSTVIDNINICEDVQIGGGTVVTRNINKPGLYVGAPARLIRDFQYE